MLITQTDKTHLVVMDASAYAQREQTLALLKILAMAHRDIEQGRTHTAESVFVHLEAMDRADGSP